MSKEFYLSLGGDLKSLRPITANSLATAKKGTYLTILGEPRRPFQLQTDKSATVWAFKPVIIDGLSMDINVSGPFLKKHGWDQIHTRNCLRIQGKLVPLEKGTAATTSSICYVNTAVRAKADSFTIVQLRAQRVQDGRMDPGPMLLRGDDSFMNNTDLHPALNAIVSCNDDGIIYAGVLNTLSEDIIIPQDMRYGSATSACYLRDPQHDQPLCGHVGLADKDRTRPVSKSDRKREYIRQFTATAKKHDTAKRAKMTKIDGNTVPTTKIDDYTEDQKKEWIFNHFQLGTSPFLDTPVKLHAAIALLLEFWDSFSHDGSFGTTHLMEHSLITEDVPPIKCRYRPINPALEPDLRKQIDLWLENDVIEPSNSPWSFNLVAAKKKGNAIRWCIDWRRLNQITKKDSFPMPTVHDNIARLAGSKIFSGIDMAGAFHCVPLRDADREKTAFSTPFGSFQQKKLGFGLCNGPATYCRLVERILKDIPTSVAIGFLDDGVVHSTDLPTHFTNLRTTLQAYCDAGLKLNPKKCTFFRDSITYLGHVLDQTGIRPTEPYIDAVALWPCPKFKTEARAFLGLTGYYRRHIKDYAHIAAPWTDVIGKTDKEGEKTPLVVTEAMKTSFETLKSKLISAPVLGFPYFKGSKAGQFILDTDFCKNQISGILSQIQDGKEIVIAFGSKKLTGTQKNWPSTKGELYAGMHWMTEYRYYLQYGPQFKWRTDNSALRYVHSMDCPTAAVQRWLATLADFDFQVEHRAGTKHTNADCLSRSQGSIPDAAATCSALAPRLFRQKDLFPYTRDELRQLQMDDEDLGSVHRWLAENQPPTGPEIRSLSRVGKIYAGLLPALSLDKAGIIRFAPPNQTLETPLTVACVPKALWDDTIRIAHVTGGHQASAPTYKRLQKSVYFPSMTSEIAGFIDTCLECQTKRRKPPDQRHTLHSVLTGYPFQRLHIDYVGPFPKGKQTGAKWILSCRDSFSKWVEGIPIHNPNQFETINALEKEIFCRFGLPESIHSDMAKVFESHLYLEVGKMLGYEITNTTGYNPKGNGQVERVHKDLGETLRALLQDNPDEWELMLPQALFSIRTAVCTSTNLTPYFILFGHNVAQPLDLIFGDPNGHILPTTKRDHQITVRNMRDRIDRAAAYARENLSAAVQRTRRHYHHEKKYFLPGTLVWLFTPRTLPGQSSKLTSFWTGPWTVAAVPINQCMVRIIPHRSWSLKQSQVVSVDRLKLYKSPKNIAPDSESDLAMEGDEFAEHVSGPGRRNPQPQNPQPPPPPGFYPGGGGPGAHPDEDDDDDADVPRQGHGGQPPLGQGHAQHVQQAAQERNDQHIEGDGPQPMVVDVRYDPEPPLIVDVRYDPEPVLLPPVDAQHPYVQPPPQQQPVQAPPFPDYYADARGRPRHRALSAPPADDHVFRCPTSPARRRRFPTSRFDRDNDYGMSDSENRPNRKRGKPSSETSSASGKPAKKIVKPRPGLPEMSRALLGPDASDDGDESEMDQFGPTDYSSDSANSASREAQIDLRRRLDRLKYDNILSARGPRMSDRNPLDNSRLAVPIGTGKTGARPRPNRLYSPPPPRDRSRSQTRTPAVIWDVFRRTPMPSSAGSWAEDTGPMDTGQSSHGSSPGPAPGRRGPAGSTSGHSSSPGPTPARRGQTGSTSDMSLTSQAGQSSHSSSPGPAPARRGPPGTGSDTSTMIQPPRQNIVQPGGHTPAQERLYADRYSQRNRSPPARLGNPVSSQTLRLQGDSSSASTTSRDDVADDPDYIALMYYSNPV